MPGMGISAYNTIGYPSAQSPGSFNGRTENDLAAVKLNNSAAPPCPTPFVANLGPVAFVDFQDATFSTGALNHLQGTILYSSPPGVSTRLEYAKSRMGMLRKPK